MNLMTVTAKGRVTIPQAVRRQLGIRYGCRVEFRLIDGHAELHVRYLPADMVSDGFGMLVSSRKSLPSDLDPASLIRTV